MTDEEVQALKRRLYAHLQKYQCVPYPRRRDDEWVLEVWGTLLAAGAIRTLALDGDDYVWGKAEHQRADIDTEPAELVDLLLGA